MKELKKGDFTGFCTKEDNKPLFYTGIFDRMKDADGRPCVFLATDPENKNTFHRWTQSDLLKRGYYITKNGKNTIPRDAARLHIIFTHSGALDGVRATVERDMFGEWTITTETGEKYAGIVGQLRNAAFCVILKTETAEEIEATRPQDGPTTPETETCGETTTSSEKAPQEATSEAARRFTIYTDSSTAGIDSRGAYTTLAEARMRLEKELDEDETSRGGYIFDELRQKVTAIYNGFNLEKIPEPYRGTPNEYTTKKERAMLESIMNKYSEPTPATPAEMLPESNQDTTTGAQDGPTTPESNTAGENTTGADKAPENATSEAGPAADHTGTPAAETATEGPETSTATQDTTGSDTRPPRATEDATTGNAAGDTSTPANQEPGTAAGAITGRTTTPPQNPGHACENAPGRTEQATPGQVHATHTKSPPRATQHATIHGRPRGHPEKTANFGRFYPLLDFSRTIFANFQGIPISVCIFGPVFDPEFWRQKRHPPGGIKISCNPRRKNFKKYF